MEQTKIDLIEQYRAELEEKANFKNLMCPDCQDEAKSMLISVNKVLNILKEGN